jgi:AcrR family transcriptional regulator
MLSDQQVETLRERARLRPWHEITTEELAQAVGVSRMTLHRQGTSKDAALAQLRELLVAEHRAAALSALSATGSARERMRRALHGICEVDERYLVMIDSLAEDLAGVFHEQGDGPVMTRNEFTDALRRILEDGRADGTLRSSDPEEDATLLFNAAGWTYRHLRLGHNWSAEHASERVTELLLHGVA